MLKDEFCTREPLAGVILRGGRCRMALQDGLAWMPFRLAQADYSGSSHSVALYTCCGMLGISDAGKTKNHFPRKRYIVYEEKGGAWLLSFIPDARILLVNVLVSQKNVYSYCSRPVFNVILVRLGASTRFFSQAQQRKRIHSPLVTILQNAILSLHFLMRMKRSFLLLTLLWGALSAWAHDAEVDGIFYNLNVDNKTATVTFKGDSYDAYYSEYAGDVVIPKAVTYNGITYSVTSLGDKCFQGCRNLTSITIPNSVTSLGDGCFSDCSSLTSITIPNSVTSLGKSCFNRCSSLTSITIPNSVTSLGKCCFNYCSSLTSITIPNSVTSLGDDCFYGCSSLTSITIPNSVTSLGDGCFIGCSSIERIEVDAANPVYDSRDNCNAIIHTSTNELVVGCKNSKIPNSVTSLGKSCFNGCRSLTSITIPNSVTSLGDRCFWDCSSFTSITIGNSVTSLGDECFWCCRSLTSITIPNSVTSLGYACFYDCRSLTSITIPNSVTSLGDGCFEGCSSLTSITIPNSVTSLGEACFYYCSSLTSITIPNSVTSLGDGCFEGCSSLTSITIPNSVTSLGDLCFQFCSSLTSITIPNSVTSLGEACFYYCSSLTSITIPNSVTSLGDGCFEGCSSLTSITIPNSVTSLGDDCFSECSSLTSINMLPTTPPLAGWDIFDSTPLETVYVVSENAKTTYQAQEPWNNYAIVVMPTGIEELETDKTAPTIVGYYDLNGKPINGKQRGAAILRYSDGTTRKVLMK